MPRQKQPHGRPPTGRTKSKHLTFKPETLARLENQAKSFDMSLVEFLEFTTDNFPAMFSAFLKEEGLNKDDFLAA